MAVSMLTPTSAKKVTYAHSLIPILLMESGTADMMVTRNMILVNAKKPMSLPSARKSIKLESAMPTKMNNPDQRLVCHQICFLV